MLPYHKLCTDYLTCKRYGHKTEHITLADSKKSLRSKERKKMPRL